MLGTDCFGASGDHGVPECTRVYPGVPRCTRVCPGVSGCARVYPGVPCLRVCPHVPGRTRGVPGCPGLYPGVPGHARVYPGSPGCARQALAGESHARNTNFQYHMRSKSQPRLAKTIRAFGPDCFGANGGHPDGRRYLREIQHLKYDLDFGKLAHNLRNSVHQLIELRGL